MSRPATVIRKLIESDPDHAVVRALQRLEPPSATVRCLRPSCSREFTWNRQGRAPRFCSETCRLQFPKERSRIEADLKAYQALLDCPTTWLKQTELEGRITLLRMQLLRYRPFER
ncbi:MAG: hypothetical protein ACRCY9_11480 [Phycicoccus sp.]